MDGFRTTAAPYERLEGVLLDLIRFMEIDGAPDVAFRVGVERA